MPLKQRYFPRAATLGMDSDQRVEFYQAMEQVARAVPHVSLQWGFSLHTDSGDRPGPKEIWIRDYL